MLTVDLADLADDEVLRSGYSWEGALRHRIDHVRAGDDEAVRRALAAAGAEAWWAGTRGRWLEQAPAAVSVARDAAGRMCGYSIAVTPEDAPPLGRRRPRARALARARARRRPRERRAVARGLGLHRRPALGRARDGRDVGDPALAAAQPALRVPADRGRRHAGSRAFSASLGGRRLDGLDARVGPLRFELHLVDWGPGGLLGAQRDVVYRELGLRPPRGVARPGAGRRARRARRAAPARRARPQPARAAGRPSRSGPRRCGAARGRDRRRVRRHATTSGRCATCSCAATSIRRRAASSPRSRCT